MTVISFGEIAALADQLSAIEKVRLIERLTTGLEQQLVNEKPKPRRSIYGIVADLGPAPSAEDIDEVRREVWKNFPRDDF